MSASVCLCIVSPFVSLLVGLSPEPEEEAVELEDESVDTETGLPRDIERDTAPAHGSEGWTKSARPMTCYSWCTIL